MPLTRVTISGADDGVDVKELEALSREFPFVEWGILLSHTRSGKQPRYPSPRWLTALEWLWGPEMKTALHVCGRAALEVMDKPARWLAHSTFKRVQINGWAPGVANLDVLGRCAREHECEFILQARSEDVLQAAAHEAMAIGSASVLFDPSGGRGIEAFQWPTAPLGARMGYAGGIKPETVLDVLAELGPRADFWIDMESGVRDEHDRFDVGRVRAVLEAAAPCVTVSND